MAGGKRLRRPKWRMTRDRFIVTFQRTTTEAFNWKPRRIIAVDIRSIPENEYDARLWFTGLIARIWWDVMDTESAASVNLDIDQLIAHTQKARVDWEAERMGANPPQTHCRHKRVQLTGSDLRCIDCGQEWTVAA